MCRYFAASIDKLHRGTISFPSHLLNDALGVLEYCKLQVQEDGDKLYKTEIEELGRYIQKTSHIVGKITSFPLVLFQTKDLLSKICLVWWVSLLVQWRKIPQLRHVNIFLPLALLS